MAENASESKYYTIDELSQKTGVSLKRIRGMVIKGEIPSTKIGNRYMIEREAADSLIMDTSFITEMTNESKAKYPSKRRKDDDVNWADIEPYWDKPTQSDLTFVDLFCGAGGLSKGLEMAGLKGICGLDWFKEAEMTYKANFKHPFVNGDITQDETKEKFYNTVNEQLNGRHLNIIAGGFPCQGFSVAGYRDVNDKRNTLYLEMLEIVKRLQPDFVICENVPGLRTMLGGNVEQQIIQDYNDIGYEMNVTTLCAADYYTPQKRNRVIFIGNRLGMKNYHPKPILDSDHYVTLGEAIGDLVNHPYDKEFSHVPTRHTPEMAQKIADTPEGGSLYDRYKEGYQKSPWNKPSVTVKANHGAVNLHPKLPRVLTERELARLQSFPDDFLFKGGKSKQLVQIGNAVPCLLGKAIGLSVRFSLGGLGNTIL